MQTYVALGDSTGVGVGAMDGRGGYPPRLVKLLEAAGQGYRLVNLAVSGAVSADVLSHQVKRAVQEQPALVTLGIGVNDVWRLVEPEVFGDQVTRILKRLVPTGARLLVTNLPDMTHAPIAKMLGLPTELLSLRLTQFNAALDTACRETGAKLVDLHSMTSPLVSKGGALFSSDGFHPSGEGYTHWAQSLADALRPPPA